MFIAVSEHWSIVHDNTQRLKLHEYLDQLETSNEFVRVNANGDRSVYDSDGAPTKVFKNFNTVLNYLQFLNEHMGLGEFVVRTFATQNELDIFLTSIQDHNYPRDIGPDR